MSISTQYQVLTPIEAWEHWSTIEQVASKEYGMSHEQFIQTLPEYQRFLGLIAEGYTSIGMFSEAVDKIWHSHILTTTLYAAFCEQIFGRYIHHIPNLQPAQDAECVSPNPCASKCLSICKTPRPDPEPEPSITDFIAAYKALYGEEPNRQIWTLLKTDGRPG